MTPDPAPRATMDPALALRTARMIALALIAGQVLFAAVVFVLLDPAGSQPSPGLGAHPIRVLETVGIITGIAAIPAAFIARRAVGSRLTPRSRAVLPSTIAFFAILEGASLFNLVVWMLNGSLFPNAVVAGVLILVAIAGFPREGEARGSAGT